MIQTGNNRTSPPSQADRIAERYHARYRGREALLALCSAALRVLPRRGGTVTGPPRRILLANYGYLGDVAISTSLIPIIQCAFPEAEIGFLVPSWASMVLEGHADVRYIHVLDHWLLDKSHLSVVYKLRRYLGDRRRVVDELRRVGYDTAIDLRLYFPNYIAELWSAAIPRRIGYTFSGLGSLLTEPHKYRYSGRHSALEQSDLLRTSGVAAECFQKQRLCLPDPSDADVAAARNKLGPAAATPYGIIHMGASKPVKEWTASGWRALATRLADMGHTIVFTGLGDRDMGAIKAAMAGLPRCVNLCDALSWRELIEVVRHARIVYTVDTSVCHLAAAVTTPCVVIYPGILEGSHMGPWSDNSVVVTHPVPCSPCFQSRGCATMDCLRALTAERVYQEGERLLKRIGPLSIAEPEVLADGIAPARGGTATVATGRANPNAAGAEGISHA